MNGRLRHTLLGRWSAMVSGHPWWVLSVAMLIAGACAITAATTLEFQSSRNDLISPDLEWNQRFLRWRSAFPGTDDLYVVVDTYDPSGHPSAKSQARAKALVDDLGPALEKSSAVKNAVWGYKIGGKGVNPQAVRLQAMGDFRRTLQSVSQARPLLANPTPGGFVQAVVQQFSDAAGAQANARSESELVQSQGAMLDRFIGLMRGFQKRFEAPADQPIDLGRFAGSTLSSGGWNYLRTENERLLIIRLTPKKQAGALSGYGQSIASIRAMLGRFAGEYQEIDFGLTGIKAVESDETASAVRGSTLASIVAAVLIAGLLIAAFHSVRVPLMLMLSLGVAIGWTFGFLTLVIGHLQVISVVFTVILLGLGVAFGIHLISRYELVRHRYDETQEGIAAALRDTLEVMGPGLLTGAVTTSAAFCTTLWTDFRGVAEMGAIAAAGVMLCLLAMVSVFPALLRLFKPDHRHLVRMEHRYFHFFEESWVGPFVRRPRLTFGLCLGLGIAATIYGLGIDFNYNLLSLLPRNAPSVTWQRRLIDRGDASVYQGVSVAKSMQEARELTAKFRELETVESVGGAGLLFPPDEPAKKRMLRKTRRQLEPALSEALADAPSSENGEKTNGGSEKALRSAPARHSQEGGNPETPEYALVNSPDPRQRGGERKANAGFSDPSKAKPATILSALARLQGLLGLARMQGPAQLQPRITKLANQVSQTRFAANSLGPIKRQARVTALQRDYRQWQYRTAKRINHVLDTSPLRLSDLPAAVVQPYISQPLRHAEVREGLGQSTQARAQANGDPSGKTAASQPKLMLQVNPKVPQDLGDPLNPRFLGNFVQDLESVDPGVTGVLVQIYYSGRLIQRAYVMAAIYALVAVIIIIWIDFRSIRDALLCLLPVAVGFACTFALLRLFGESINAANIIVLPLMFGIGVDDGVHMIHRYRQDPDGKPPGLTAGTGKGIALTSYTTIIGFASLIVAAHRGISSLGLTLAIGIAMTLLACWTLMPATLELRTRRRQRQRLDAASPQNR